MLRGSGAFHPLSGGLAVGVWRQSLRGCSGWARRTAQVSRTCVRVWFPLSPPSAGAPGLLSAVFSRWALETGYLREYSREFLAENDRMHNTQTYAHRTLI